jgi:plastocyanin
MTSTTKGSSKKNLALVGAAVAVGFLLTVAGMPSLSSAQTQEQGQEQQQQQTESATAAANFESPYLIANGTELTPANPEEKNTEPLIIPGQPKNGDGTPAAASNDIIVAANARSTNPVVIDSENNVTYLPLNANYTMTEDELYVNSGWMWPEGQAPPGAPPIKSFSVTFADSGTYDYICLVHPWMTGQVVVQ